MKKIIFTIFILTIASISHSVSAASNDVLSVSGNKILLNGSEIMLRGVAVGDPQAREIVYKRTNKDFQTIKNNWSANVVRLSVHPGVFANDWKRGRGLLEKEVAGARAQGLFVIIDWHVIGTPDGWYKPTTSNQPDFYNYDSDFNLAVKFWLYASQKFQADQGIIFELWNEPIDSDSSLTWDGLKPKIQSLADLIRGKGAKNLMLAPGVYWTYDLRGIKDNPINDTNTAYAWHYYNGFQEYASAEVALDGLNEKYPVIITEWGSDNEKDLGYDFKNGLNQYHYLESVKNIIIKNNLHYTAWCWHAAWKPKMLDSNWIDPNKFGLLVKDFLKNPDKVKIRLQEDEAKKQHLQDEILAREEAELAAKIKKQEELASLKIKQAEEFKLRINAYLADGADANSHKLGMGERKAVLDSFKLAFGHQPGNENEWQDLISISNGHWPARSSVTAEEKAKIKFLEVFKRSSDLNNNIDKHTIKIMSYGLRQRPDKKNTKREKDAILKFKKIYNHNPGNTQEWNVAQGIAYGGVR